MGKTRAKAQQAGASVFSGVREGGHTEKVTFTHPGGERVGDVHISSIRSLTPSEAKALSSVHCTRA